MLPGGPFDFLAAGFCFPPMPRLRPSKRSLPAGFLVRRDIEGFRHHGSRTASSNAYLKAVNPEVVVIMCGSGNEYGHPHRGRPWLLAAVGEHLLDGMHGTIIVVTDGKDYTVKYGRGLSRDEGRC